MATISEFLYAIKSDETLNQKFLELCGERPETKEAMAQAEAKAAAELGYDVPVEEFRLAGIESDELSDEDLEAVAGGSDITDNPIVKEYIDAINKGIDLYNTVSPHICWKNNLCVAWYN